MPRSTRCTSIGSDHESVVAVSPRQKERLSAISPRQIERVSPRLKDRLLAVSQQKQMEHNLSVGVSQPDVTIISPKQKERLAAEQMEHTSTQAASANQSFVSFISSRQRDRSEAISPRAQDRTIGSGVLRHQERVPAVSPRLHERCDGVSPRHERIVETPCSNGCSSTVLENSCSSLQRRNGCHLSSDTSSLASSTSISVITEVNDSVSPPRNGLLASPRRKRHALLLDCVLAFSGHNDVTSRCQQNGLIDHEVDNKLLAHLRSHDTSGSFNEMNGKLDQRKVQPISSIVTDGDKHVRACKLEAKHALNGSLFKLARDDKAYRLVTPSTTSPPVFKQPSISVKLPMTIAQQGLIASGSGPQKDTSTVCRWKGCSVTTELLALYEHIRSTHIMQQVKPGPDAEQSFVCLWDGCKVYDKPSTLQTWLERHVVCHLGARPHLCIFTGCGQRFSSQYALQRHVNSHLGACTDTFQARKDVSRSAATRKKKLRDCRPCTVKTVDYFDTLVTESLRATLVRSTEVTQMVLSESGNSVTFHASVIGRRTDTNGDTQVLLHWHPSDVIPDTWVAEFSVTEDPSSLSLDCSLASLSDDFVQTLLGRSNEASFSSHVKRRRKQIAASCATLGISLVGTRT